MLSPGTHAVPRVALVTAAHVDPTRGDEGGLVAALAARGIDATWQAWDAPEVAWAGFDLVVLRSCWDYHRREAAFVRWLHALRDDGVRLANPVDRVLANRHKGYLLALAEHGIPIPDTELLPAGTSIDLGARLAALGWEDAVLKPAVSASADSTWRVRTAGLVPSALRLATLLEQRDMLLQRFLPAIGTGELSLIHIEGRFSHAVAKRPAEGDFRSQEEFGAQLACVEADAATREVAARALELQGADCLYARVDLVLDAAGPRLMELELIEPSLFLRLAPEALPRFAAAIADRARAGARKELERRVGR